MSDAEERTYRVEMMTRVEGEGSFTLRVKDGEVVDAELAIFEAPRFFEAFLRGRSPADTVDIVARICGICPVAYQMSASMAFERAAGVEVPAEIAALKRLLYCGEWIESHVLHVFMLHAPDFLGYPSAVEMAADHRDVVESGLRQKKAGNRILEVLGGRATHPVSPRPGGFYKAPRKKDLEALLPMLEAGLEESVEAVRWTAGLDIPAFEQDYVFVSLSGDAYPLEAGTSIAVSGPGGAPMPDGSRRREVPLDAWGDEMEEHHVERSNALQARLKDGTPYLCGPMARLHHHAEKLHPTAAEVMAEVGLPRTVLNPYRSIVVRAVETVHAFAEAVDLVKGYEAPARGFVDTEPRSAVGCGATEAPRGLLWHRYAVDADGLIEEARIVPPTSQNQARIEDDLRGLAPELLSLDHAAATHRCEQLIRAYDPCISCATHFLDLRIERG
ncbi:MAG TPA: nickel-dependent hydrogenase large subunit [Sandaracinaceae bacterium LLY-WYZ-13_1]|nr:nickel-dependent hydrogenase large subunit [Sandaracinaceae bacterium LLY-WYZ-13_1]